MMIYLASLQNVPQESHETAVVGGTGYWKQLRYIVLPMIVSAFMINFILVFGESLKDFDSIFALTDGGPRDSTMTIVLDIYRESFFYSRGSHGTTISVILFVVMIILVIIQLKFFQKGETKLGQEREKDEEASEYMGACSHHNRCRSVIFRTDLCNNYRIT